MGVCSLVASSVRKGLSGLSFFSGVLQLARGLKTFTIAFQPAEECTSEEREVLTVSSAKASLAWRAKSEQAQAALEQARKGLPSRHASNTIAEEDASSIICHGVL